MEKRAGKLLSAFREYIQVWDAVIVEQFYSN